MGASRRERHRDREPGRRDDDESERVPLDRPFRITHEQRQEIATALRLIDEARRALMDQQNPDNREIIRELRASADRIYDLINGLEEAHEE